MNEAWFILGDFNAVLYKEDKMQCSIKKSMNEAWFKKPANNQALNTIQLQTIRTHTSNLITTLQEFNNTAGLQANLRKSQMVLGGCSHTLQSACLLTKIEYRSLVNKITAKVHTWSTRSISFTARARLINVELKILQVHGANCSQQWQVWVVSIRNLVLVTRLTITLNSNRN
ncbi:hypothetical protein Cgig2_020028 [Carnegiea gigantea]|uniref:Uncharacterized protein n=1 Tax=Carnegiea gigantea TaxID=171969 RepID=A0A9Q1K1R9_9CARY|nr:hypothetical protein Cgig2_020028 [Carnegiea gigantea]